MQGRGREVILGVGGGIAAYKSCDLLRRLLDFDFRVTVVPTPSSLNFVGRATWEALSGREVTTEVFESVHEVRHISLAKQADFIVLAPATADLIARISQGRADDLLTNVLLAANVPVLVVPAMHPHMWNDQATQTNVNTLRARGFIVMEPVTGPLTSGDIGQGRFPSTAEILDAFAQVADRELDLIGKRVLVTAGGTREAIDPIRFIGNQSSGKQGYAIARDAVARGAEVTVIAANVQLPDIPGARTIRVESAAQMFKELQNEFPETHILAMAAAVADARPLHISESKIKKSEYSTIELTQNPDLLADLSSMKTNQVVIAFAAETSHDEAQAEKKLTSKGADILYLNDVSSGDIFNSETTFGEIFLASGSRIKVAKTTKDTLAHQLLDQALLQLG
jgi:phosphopantothenoylcysteine decarboxylase/phosphopantothenate--cysteine ligase